MSQCWCGGLVVRSACVDSEFHDPSATGRPEKIERLYIAGPMTGYPECNYPAFNAAAKFLRQDGFDVVNPAEFGARDLRVGVHYVDLIREDLRLMLDCHGVATLDGWWESVGARNEVMVAGVLKMPVRTIDEWLRLRLRP
jgi:hypothetical protein